MSDTTALPHAVLDSPAIAESVVILSDGTLRDLNEMSDAQLVQLQWDEERQFARRITQAPKGSPQRSQARRHAYETVPKIVARLNSASADPMQMGHDRRYDRLAVALLKRQQRRGLAPRLFEIGFGSGSLLQYVSQRGFDVSGIEVSPSLHEHTQAMLGRSGRGQLYLGDFLQQHFVPDAESFSLIYWNDVFEHLPPDETLDFLAKIRRLLVPGGQLVTITPNWHDRPNDVTGDVLPPRTEAQGLHLKEYTLREMTRLLREAGFDRVATPLCLTRRNIVLGGTGLATIKRTFEPLLERVPFWLAHKLCRGLALMCTIATKCTTTGSCCR